MTQQNIAKSIKTIRKVKGFTQEQAAEKLHISAEAYSKIENGKTSVNTDRLAQIAEAFGVSVQDIYDFNPQNFIVNQNTKKAETVAGLQVNTSDVTNKLIECLEQTISEQKETIEYLKTQNTVLLGMLKKDT